MRPGGWSHIGRSVILLRPGPDRNRNRRRRLASLNQFVESPENGAAARTPRAAWRCWAIAAGPEHRQCLVRHDLGQCSQSGIDARLSLCKVVCKSRQGLLRRNDYQGSQRRACHICFALFDEIGQQRKCHQRIGAKIGEHFTAWTVTEESSKAAVKSGTASSGADVCMPIALTVVAPHRIRRIIMSRGFIRAI